MFSWRFYMGCALFGVLLHRTEGRFPMVCAKNVTEGAGICCPVPSGFTEPCGGTGRGVCGKLPVVRQNYYPRTDPSVMEQDDRFNWPLKHVQYGCRCEQNFDGYDCSECKYGYEGTECKDKEIHVRRNLESYTPEERKNFIDTLLASKTVLSGWGVLVASSNQTGDVDMVELTVWDLFQYSHYRTSHTLREGGGGADGQCRPASYNFAHNGPGFATWHRHFLLWAEREFRKLSKDRAFALPYWDWVDDTQCDICTNDLMGEVLPDGTIHPGSRLSSWRTICDVSDPCGCDPRVDAGPLRRGPARLRNTTLPTDADVRHVLSKTVYDAFPFTATNDTQHFVHGLEGGLTGTGMHAAVHDWVGGVMGNLLTAANDPLFLLHHTFVDKLFEVWLRNNGLKQYPTEFGPAGHLAGDPLVPFYPPEYHLNYFKDSVEYGFDYDSLLLSSDIGQSDWAGLPTWQVVLLVVCGLVISTLLMFTIWRTCRHPITKNSLRASEESSESGVDVESQEEKHPLLPK